MSLLLLFNQEFQLGTDILDIPRKGLNFEIDEALANHRVRLITGFEISYDLGNRAILRCQTIDAGLDKVNAYHPQEREKVYVATKLGVPIYSGLILKVRNGVLEEPNTGTQVDLDVSDLQFLLDRRYLTHTFGTEFRGINALTPIAGGTNVFVFGGHGYQTGDHVTIEEAGTLTPAEPGIINASFSGPNNNVKFTTREAFEGANKYSIEFIRPDDQPDVPLSYQVLSDPDLTAYITLATGPDNAVITTANDIVALFNGTSDLSFFIAELGEESDPSGPGGPEPNDGTGTVSSKAKTNASGAKDSKITVDETSPINGSHIVTVVDVDHFTVPVSMVTQLYGGQTAKKPQLLEFFEVLQPILLENGITIDPVLLTDTTWVDRKIYDDARISDVLKDLAGSTDRLYRLLPSGVLELFAAGTKVSDFTFDASNVLGGTGWEKDQYDWATAVRLQYGGNQTATKVVEIRGDGVTRIWPLPYRPASHGTALGPGNLYDSAAAAWRHVGAGPWDNLHEWVYRPDVGDNGGLAQLEIFSNPPTPTVPYPEGWVGSFQYPIKFPQTVIERNPPGPYGPQEQKFTAEDIFDHTIARARARQKLDELNNIVRKGTLVTRAGFIMPGTVVNVDLPDRHMVGQFLITAVRMAEDEDVKIRYWYTVVEGSRATPNWVEQLRQIFGTGSKGSRSMSASGGSIGGGSTPPVAPAPGGGLSGEGEENYVAVWQSDGSLGDGPAFINVDSNLEVETDLVVQGDLIVGRVQAVGDLVLAPTGDLVIDPDTNIVVPAATHLVHLGQPTERFLTLHVDELWVETLVAQETIATIGGSLIIAPSTNVESDISTIHTTIVLKHNEAETGDQLLFKKFGQLEIMQVTGGPTGTGPYSYTVTRNRDGSGANTWIPGDSAINTGVVGDGFIDAYSRRGTKSASEVGPTIVGNVRFGTGAFDWEPRWALGNLRGLYGFATDTYGVAIGKRTGVWQSWDDTNGLRMMFNNTVVSQITPAGSASFTGSVTVTGGNAALIDMSNVTTIDGGKITTGTLHANRITSGTITGTQIAGTTITGAHIQAGSIDGDRITANTITADRLNVTDLSAVSADLGDIQAGAEINFDNGSLIYGRTDVSSLHMRSPISGIWSQINLYPGFVELWGATGGGGNSVYLDQSTFAPTGGISLGSAGDPWDHVHIDGDIKWYGPPTTTSDDSPVVYSSGNQQFYVKSNGFTGTVNSPSQIVVQNGIVTDVI